MPQRAVKPAGPTATGHAVGARQQEGPLVSSSNTDSEREHQKLIGPNNETVVEVNGEGFTALIDSGSQITAISESLWKEHPQLQCKQLTPVSVIIQGASGQTLPYLGVIPISLTILGVVYDEVPAFVVPSDPYKRRVPVLVGTNIIRAARRDQNLSRGNSFMESVKKEDTAWHTAFIKTTVSEPGDHQGSIGYAKYIGRSPIVVPPGTEVDVICQAPDGPDNYTAVVEGFLQSKSSLEVGSLVADVDSNRQVPVRLCNISARPITITRNSRLAKLSSVLRIDEPSNTQLMSDKDIGVAAQLQKVTVEVANSSPSIDLSEAAIDDDLQKKQLDGLLQEYSDVFSTSSLDFGRTSTIKHTIPLVDNQPFRLPYRRIPPSQYQAVREHIQAMEETGAIRRSSSPYASPIVIVHKKDGSLRICMDYRQLNAKTIRDAFPLPRIEEALDALGNATLFSTLDLTSGYWQVEVDEDDKHKTAFTTPWVSLNVTECLSDCRMLQPHFNA